MIQISNVTKTHGRHLVLDDIGFHAAAGRVTGFVGPNGAGKSSTLRILLGLDRAARGTATIGGLPYRRLKDPLRTVGAMLDGAGAHPSRTVRDHLGWVGASAGISRARIEEVLEVVDLAGARRQRVRSLSLGMGQRLGLATALLGDPEVLVLDEPVNGLDPEGIRWIRRLLRGQAAQGRTVLLSSHLMSELAEVADDVVVIASGRIVAQGPVADVVERGESLEEAFFALTGQGR